MRNRLAALPLAAFVVLAGCGPGAPPATDGGPPQLRRLTEDQYRRAIADVFGPDIKIAGRFEPDVRRNGLLSVGAASVSVTPAGFEQYHSMARAIADQVTGEARRDALIPCKPAAETAPDDACTTVVVEKYGRLLLRRPLQAVEIAARTAEAKHATEALGSYWAGLSRAVSRLLESPEFLFRVDAVEADPKHTGQVRLTGHAKASRLSYFLWDAAPDEALLAAAANGELHDEELLARQVDRLLASPRLRDGVRAFFTDLLQLAELDHLAKDNLVYPAFTPRVAQAAREQTLLTLTNLLLDQAGDYRDIFTTRQTFLNRTLGPVYWLPVTQRDGWVPYTFPDDDPRVGIQTHLAFTALHSHPGRSSATLRGKAVREILLCQPVAAPPANVNFSLVQDTANSEHKTARDRLTAHSSDPTCAGCHKVMDPLGLALENFDGSGRFRSQENGVVIDTSGDLGGQHFRDSVELGRALREEPAALACLVDKLFQYAVGRNWLPNEQPWHDWAIKAFAADRYRFAQLLRRVATSDAFYRIEPPKQDDVKEIAR